MTGTQFNLSISILFVGYLTMQLPSNLLITRMRPSLYLGITMLVWGGVCAATAAVRNFAQLLVVRIFLGVTEAPFFPGVISSMLIMRQRKIICVCKTPEADSLFQVRFF
jgi:MFS family permease